MQTCQIQKTFFQFSEKRKTKIFFHFPWLSGFLFLFCAFNNIDYLIKVCGLWLSAVFPFLWLFLIWGFFLEYIFVFFCGVSRNIQHSGFSFFLSYVRRNNFFNFHWWRFNRFLFLSGFTSFVKISKDFFLKFRWFIFQNFKIFVKFSLVSFTFC